MKLKKVQKVYQAENRINDLSEIENGNFETAPEKESVLHNFINTKDGIKIVISDSSRNIKKVDYETGKEVVISVDGQIVKDYMNQGTANYYTYGFDNPKLDEGKFDKNISEIFFRSFRKKMQILSDMFGVRKTSRYKIRCDKRSIFKCKKDIKMSPFS